MKIHPGIVKTLFSITTLLFFVQGLQKNIHSFIPFRFQMYGSRLINLEMPM
jgi:hypothetical protein